MASGVWAKSTMQVPRTPSRRLMRCMRPGMLWAPARAVTAVPAGTPARRAMTRARAAFWTLTRPGRGQEASMRSASGPWRVKVVAASVMDTAASLTHQSVPRAGSPSTG